MQDGEIGLSEIAASRLGVAAGDTVELPTVEGPKHYRVAGIFHPRMVNDAAVGDIVLVSEGWRVPIGLPYAIRSRWTIRPPPTRPPTVTISSNLGAGLWVYDNEQWRSVATSGITRFLEPFTIAGYVVMAAAGLSVLNVFVLGLVQRKRERAALRAIGVTPGQEQAVIIANAGCSACWSPARGARGCGPDISVVAGLTGVLRHQDRLGCAAAGAANRSGGGTVIVLAAAVYPVIHARRLETVEVLRDS